MASFTYAGELPVEFTPSHTLVNKWNFFWPMPLSFIPSHTVINKMVYPGALIPTLVPGSTQQVKIIYSGAEIKAYMVCDLIFEEVVWKGLPIAPDRITDVTPEFRTIITVFESGREQRACMQSKPKRTFKCLYHLLTADQIANMVLFHERCFGSFKAFRFLNHHTGDKYNARFKEDKLDFEYINSRFASLSFEVVTC